MGIQTKRYVSSVISVMICVLLVTACDDGKNVAIPTGLTAPPTQTLGNIAGSWTGTYNTNDDIDCDTSISLPAKANFEQNGSTVAGHLKATGSCGLDYPFQGTLEGNTLRGVITGSLNPPGTASGTLSDATLVISAYNGYGYNMGHMQLHR